MPSRPRGGRRPPPELGQRHRPQPCTLRVREQLGRRAISGAAGRGVGREQVADGAHLAARVAQLVAREQMREEFIGALGAAALDGLTRCRLLPERAMNDLALVACQSLRATRVAIRLALPRQPRERGRRGGG